MRTPSDAATQKQTNKITTKNTRIKRKKNYIHTAPHSTYIPLLYYVQPHRNHIIFHVAIVSQHKIKIKTT